MDVGEKLYENRTIREKTWFAILGYSALTSYNYFVLPEMWKNANVFMDQSFSESVSTRIEYSNQYDMIGVLTNNGFEALLLIAIGYGAVLTQRLLRSFPIKMEYSKDKDVLYIHTYDIFKDTIHKSAHMTEHMQFIPTYASG